MVIKVAKLLSKKIIKNEVVYDIEVEDNHNFFANDILVHNCSNKKSDQGANLLKLDSEYKVAATGTLITNDPISCYLPLYWTGHEHSTLTNYKNFYCTFGGFQSREIIGFKNLDLLQEEVQKNSLRRTLSEVRSDMPSKTIKTEIVEMSEEHKKFYEAIKNGIKEELSKIDKVKIDTSNLLALTTRLRQASATPSILTTEKIESSKLLRCAELASELADQGEKVVIMATFRDSVYEVARYLEKYKPLINTGDVRSSVVDENVEKFQNDPTSLIFIGTTDRISTGLTLNAASYLIMVDEQWSSYKNSQAHDRIWRVNNTRPAIITILMCKDTIDERIHDVVQMKKDLGDYMVDGVENNFAVEEEMRKVLSEL